MGFVIYCNNKGCGKSQEPMLDKASNEVYCSECGGVMPGISQFTKTAMAGIGQLKRQVASKTAFAIKCAGCSRVEQPKVKNSNLVCPMCGADHKGLVPAFAHAIKQFLSGAK